MKYLTVITLLLLFGCTTPTEETYEECYHTTTIDTVTINTKDGPRETFIFYDGEDVCFTREVD